MATIFDREPAQIHYKRTGILSQTTGINEQLADRFMRVSDIRYDISITDSDKEPESSAVAVGSDVLAWKKTPSFSEMVQVSLKSRKFREVQRTGESIASRYEIRLHDRVIDADIREKGFEDQADFHRQYLARLNEEVRAGLSDILTGEKVGLHAQKLNYMSLLTLLVQAPLMYSIMGPEGLIYTAAFKALVVNPLYSCQSNIAALRMQKLREELHIPDDVRTPLSPSNNPRSWKEMSLPPVPVDKWIMGQSFLFKNGNRLIIPVE